MQTWFLNGRRERPRDREALVKKLYTDKKVRDGKLRFVFQKGIGEVMTFGEDVYARPVAEEEIREILMNM